MSRASSSTSAKPRVAVIGGGAIGLSIGWRLACAAVLLNTAVAKSRDLVRMARAMRAAVEAGFAARQAGRIPRRDYAEPSSPELVGLIGG